MSEEFICRQCYRRNELDSQIKELTLQLQKAIKERYKQDGGVEQEVLYTMESLKNVIYSSLNSVEF